MMQQTRSTEKEVTWEIRWAMQIRKGKWWRGRPQRLAPHTIQPDLWLLKGTSTTSNTGNMPTLYWSHPDHSSHCICSFWTVSRYEEKGSQTPGHGSLSFYCTLDTSALWYHNIAPQTWCSVRKKHFSNRLQSNKHIHIPCPSVSVSLLHTPLDRALHTLS